MSNLPDETLMALYKIYLEERKQRDLTLERSKLRNDIREFIKLYKKEIFAQIK